mmetsp:Transcript_23739/g.51860  ORF Transcript_23739/g.51860 Transcript_23739/m.51860 type:complete len:597 (+) Transcript_23739:102-1892(+)|eukprot:CAMPEP_0206576004 /NCGR_PEP_ID=MMETSP0325_2-20121206/30461_1 /ASSEMBLY_ACC=CAM_ASM_000347 /TAXON_ID=2866 /ORGANISM="Crypthecodinium cohnii, Strain Seligo" /LENGTH=596 /DNA_ID=CAMNT_0054081073 /DNA_START=95 /DNA_END=1885 /DNA_ORIENTATION=-
MGTFFGLRVWLLAAWVIAAAALVEVHTTSGVASGILLPADEPAGGEAVEQYLGIPFATAKRFEPPQDFVGPYPHGAVDASMWGPACMQVAANPSETYGSEDCLKANVWRPASAANGARSPLPVMVFIYGGSNQFGEAEPYNMSALAAFHEVVCVSFNYRTGPIGWMAFQEDLDAGRPTGNWGILDIQSALRWVQREALALGGDPTKVAIHGQSSGAELVELQYVAPGSRGLFQGAISESGGLSAQDIRMSLFSAKQAAQAAGCLVEGAVSKACMQKAAAVNITVSTYTGSWGPAVDGVTFPKQPMELLEAGAVNDASIMLGAQTNDSNLFLFRSYTKDGLDQPNDHADGDLRGISVSDYKKSLFQSVGAQHLQEALGIYPPDEKDGVQNVHQLGNVGSDKGHCSIRKRASLLNKFNPGRAFSYRFDYWYTSNRKCSAVPNFHLPYLGAAHQDEVTFVLGQPNFMEDGSCCGVWGLTTPDCPHLTRCQACYDPELFGRSGYLAYFNDEEWKFTRLVGSMWTNMAASGHPHCREAGCAAAAAWPSPDSEGGPIRHNIVLNATLKGGFKMEKTPYDRPDICDFWDRVAASQHGEEMLVV